MKIAVYFNHYQTLGHTSRVYALIKGLKEGLPADILLLHSGKPQDFFALDKYAQVLDLPFSVGRRWFKLERHFKFDEKAIKMYGVENLFTKRLAVIKKALADFKPHIFITEFYPFGKELWSFELKYVLEFLKSHSSTKILSSIGYPACEDDTAQRTAFYDHFLFHCEETEIEEFIRFLKEERSWLNLNIFLSALNESKGRVRCTGYLFDAIETAPALNIRHSLGIKNNQRFVVVSRGGGVDCPNIISYAILAAKKLKDIFFLISAGPATPKEELSEYRRLAKGSKNIALVDFARGFENYLNACDLSINMAGYNTMVRLLYLRKQSITIPLSRPEQRFRARYFERFGIFKKIDYERLTAKKLLETTHKLLSSPLKPSSHIIKANFNGLDNTVRFIRCLR